MTIKDTINALPWYQRGSVDQLINEWNRDNTLTRFLQGAGNKEELEALIANFDNEDWTMFGGPGPKTPQPPVEETPEPEVLETPLDPELPVEDETAGDDE